jgi:phosphatidylglycerophosphate synthase
MLRGDLIAFMVIVALAILLAELQYRQEVSSRWCVLALIWIIATALLIWTAYGA